jgi:outer membrane protein assembly factor BamD (BamD/ComL family)
LSLTQTIYIRPLWSPLPRTLLGINAASAQAKTPQQGKDEALRLYKVGLQQLNTGQLGAALQTFEQALGIFKAIGELNILLLRMLQMQQNSDKAAALRQTMLTTMKQHPNPKNWAAFTLIGETE